MERTEQELLRDFPDAVKVWFGDPPERDVPAAPEDVLRLWCGPCALLEYARARCRGFEILHDRHPLIGSCDDAFDRLCDPEAQHFDLARAWFEILLPPDEHDVVGADGSTLNQVAAQVARRMKGFLAAVRAVRALDADGWTAGCGRPVPQFFGKAAAECLEAFANWPCGGFPHDAPLGPGPAPAHDRSVPTSVAALDNWLQNDDWPPNRRTAGHWLLLHRLLAYVLEEDDPKWDGDRRRVATNTGQMLLVEKRKVGQQVTYEGLLRPLTAAVANSLPVSGWYLDPVTLGLTPIDGFDTPPSGGTASFGTSLHHAGQVAAKDVATLFTATRFLSVRVSPETNGISLLTGSSAGLLAAAAMVATVRGVPLDADSSATVAFRLRTAEDESETLHLHPVGADSLSAKLAGARDKGLRRVVVHAEQTLKRGGDWQDFAAWQPVEQRLGSLLLRPVEFFDQAYDELTAHAGIERVLEEHCRRSREAWDRDPATVPEGERHLLVRPVPYVEPHYASLPEGRSPYDRSEIPERPDGPPGAEPTREDRYAPLVGNGEIVPELQFPTEREGASGEPSPTVVSADEELDRLVGLGPRLCLTEDAGAGKTVVTHRLVRYFSDPRAWDRFFGGRPPLVVRFESRDNPWPADVRQALIAAIGPVAKTEPGNVEPADVVDYALEHGRVVIIHDAFDQVSGPDREQRLEAIWSWFRTGAGQKARIVVTSRAFAVNAASNETWFPRTQWRFATILGFSPAQQYEFLREFLPAAAPAAADRDPQEPFRRRLRALLPNYDEVHELLAVPVLLRMVRDVARQRRDALPEERRGEQVVLSEFRTRGDFYRAAHEVLEQRAAKQGLDIDTHGARWRRILAAAAYEMMSRGLWSYSLSGRQKVDLFKQAVSQRCVHPETGQREPVTPQEWRDLTRFSQLTDHCILDGVEAANLSWKHRGWMEFFGGEYLALYAPAGIEEELRRVANDPQWYWPFRFAIETPPEVRDGAALCRSLSVLFERPTNGKRRPCELIWRAWHLFEWDVRVARELPGREAYFDAWWDPQVRDKLRQAAAKYLLPGRETVLAKFRAVVDPPPEEPLIVPSDRVPGDVWVEPKTSAVFVRCPPTGWRPAGDRDPCEFAMGSADVDPHDSVRASHDERPRHPVRVEPFDLQTTPVTVGQYRRFDYVGAEFVADETYPMVDVDWWAAFAYAKWLGPDYGLPTETQWEFACRAGTATTFWTGDELRSDQANFGATRRRTTPVTALPPNPWSLHDMHGNVWQWCGDWYAEDWYNQRRGTGRRTDEGGPLGGSDRVTRGGCWNYSAGGCRSALRNRGTPEFRRILLGFRVARSSVR